MDEQNTPMRYEQIDELARRILAYARDSLLVDLRFLDMALDMLSMRNYSGTLATDGRELYYDPYYIVFTFRQEPARVLRQMLHMLLHCVFHHLFAVEAQLDRRRWDTACDIAVENVIAGLDLPELIDTLSFEEREQLQQLESRLGVLTADRLYHWFQEQDLPEHELADLRQPYQADDHRIWYLPEKPGGREGRRDDEGEAGGKKRDVKNQPDAEQQWKAVSAKLADRLSERTREAGFNAAALLQNLLPITRERQSYADFLRRFAVYGEVLQISREEFDLVFYTYGLRLYGNLPLIEPLEYSEARRIRDFVVAIDTSGSVKGWQVQAFVRRTYEILSEQDSFFRKVCIHVIQCDAEIQEDARITSAEELEQYLRSMTLKGFGGTDFRPVFRHVEQLRAAGEFNDLRGLIYFTDGKGIFPESRPDYETAFLFLEDGGLAPEVPAWAIRLVLTADEIQAED